MGVNSKSENMKKVVFIICLMAGLTAFGQSGSGFGIKGGLGTALVVSIFYLPHIMLQWGGLVETNLMRFLQLILFFVMIEPFLSLI